MSAFQLPPVETVGFYSRNSDFELYKSPPTKLNTKGEFALSKPSLSSLIRLEITADDNADERQHENYMQSLLWFNRENPHLLEGIEFVTFRQVLASVAASRKCERIMAFRKYGITWIAWHQEPKEEIYDNDDDDVREDKRNPLGRGRAFANTIVMENKESTEFQKTVNRISLPIPGELNGTVLYSAETDAWHRHKDESVEIKSTTYPFYKFLKVRGKYCFWQSYFGNVKAIILGKLKTISKEKNVYSIFRLFTHTPETLLKAIKKHWFRWSVEEGIDRVGELLKACRGLLKEEDDAKVLEHEWKEGVFQWVEDTEAKFDQEFIKQVELQMEKIFGSRFF